MVIGARDFHLKRTALCEMIAFEFTAEWCAREDFRTILFRSWGYIWSAEIRQRTEEHMREARLESQLST